MSIPMHTIPGYENTKPGVQVGTKLIPTGENQTYTPDDYKHLRQMGVEWAMVDGPLGLPDAKVYKELRKQVEGEA